jgi:pimeloyl-ACP methyl ester carboxylesterase
VSRTLRIQSDGETLQADLYGELPARRTVILVHGQNWDGNGWRQVAPRFVERGVPALAINLRGKDGSTGTTDEFVEGKPWSPVTDLRAAKQALREQGAREVALVGASLGGHAVMASSFENDVESVVAISAPVIATPDHLSRLVSGRKLFVFADEDRGGIMPHVLRTFAAASAPKTMLVFGGQEHSRGMFAAPYGQEAIAAIVDFIARGL